MTGADERELRTASRRLALQFALIILGLFIALGVVVYTVVAAGQAEAARKVLADASMVDSPHDAPRNLLVTAVGPDGRDSSPDLPDGLPDEKALAHQLSLRLEQHRDAGLMVVQALAAHGQTAAPLAQALQQEVLRLADEPVTDEELDKAKAMLRRETLSVEWTADRLARALGTAWAVRGDAGAPARDMAVWVKLSGAELQQFWRKQVVQAPVLTLLADIGAAAGVAA